MYLLKKLLVILTIVMTISNSSAQEAIVLYEGKPAPYTGLLLPEAKALELYNDIHKYKLLNESYERSIVLYKGNEELMNKKTQMLLEQNDKLAESLQKARNVGNWEKILWFGLGFLSVGMGIYGVKTITK